MKPASILLLAAAGLSSALPAMSGTAKTGVQARDSRSLFGHAINAIAARNLVPLNANTAAPPPAADPAADKKEAPAAAPPAATPTDKKVGDDKKAGDAKATDKAGDAKATDAAATTTAAAVTTTAAATDAAATEAATTTTAAPAIETTSVAVGNGTASDNGKGKGNGKDNGKGKNQGQGKGKHNNNNNNDNNGNNALSAAIAGALNTLGLDGVLDASSLDKLSVGNQISLLAQIVSLQTMKDLQMVGGQDIVIVLNQGFKSNGLNVIINA
ncbi:uncharacterized protein Triagg1_2304 [Trichoderma aggressivum f. europaeum]|uniref:Hydrophobin n=1 Tax=Trichoderma aggressivum f. europaeum TaxID=173218 RepID=A0AAE1IHU3_9HYPO|nr:hypothetical protein Triagg1_2304 [Trichoderma aggressivum f. europaeum]